MDVMQVGTELKYYSGGHQERHPAQVAEHKGLKPQGCRLKYDPISKIF
jgi:hypothetical protein